MKRANPDQIEIAYPSAAGVEATTPPPAQAHSPTSVRAAAKLKRMALAGARLEILRFLVLRFDIGATDEEIQAHLKLKGDTQRPRRGELHRYGLIDKGGERQVSSGNDAVYWVATARGREFLDRANAAKEGEAIYLE